MGTDKASLLVDGVPMARRGVDALRGAHIEDVVVMGGSADFGGRLIPDAVPGVGPLDALRNAFGATAPADLVVLPCDLPWIEASTVTTLVRFAGERPDASVVIGTVEGRRAWPVGLWRRRIEPVLDGALAAGIRSFREAVAMVDVAEIELGPSISDADEPCDLPHTDTLAGGGHHDHGGAS
jgi:molybdopterin-guanine dinucleotide biosynthesis protein A